VPHFEVAFERVPSEGSVVVDTEGRAVGLVSDETSVLPIEAWGPAPTWSMWLENTRAAAAAEVRELRTALGKPGLLTALTDGSGRLYAVLLSRTTSQSELTLQQGTCPQTAKVSWEPFRVNDWYDHRSRALMQFIDKNDLDIGLSMSTVELSTTCSGEELHLDGADPVLHQARVGKTSQTMSASASPSAPVAPNAPASASAARRAESAGPDERTWRARFVAARDELERFEAQLREKQRFIDEADHTVRRASLHRRAAFTLAPGERDLYDQYKKDLENADEQRAAIKRRQEDLEREASFAGVPREWRR
jgi:hypothetical protein